MAKIALTVSGHCCGSSKRKERKRSGGGQGWEWGTLVTEVVPVTTEFLCCQPQFVSLCYFGMLLAGLLLFAEHGVLLVAQIKLCSHYVIMVIPVIHCLSPGLLPGSVVLCNPHLKTRPQKSYVDTISQRNVWNHPKFLCSRNAMCGKLQCENVKTLPVFGIEPAIIKTPIKGYTCWGVDFQLGSDVPDPGMVNEGTKCSPGKVSYTAFSYRSLHGLQV